jgi:phospholipase C
VTTVVAPTTTAPPVTPDAPPAPKPKPKPKPKVTTTTHTRTVPATSPSTPSVTTQAPPTPSVHTTPTIATTKSTNTTGAATLSPAEVAAKRERAALRAQVDRSKKIKARELKRLYTDIPKPTYPLTRPGGGDHPRTPIKHFIYLLQENHTFDNYFGTYGRGSDGTPPGTCMPINLGNPKGKCIKPFRLGGRAVTDIGHNVIIFRGQYNHGKMNGFANVLRLQGVDPTNVMGYYDGKDIPYYWNLADQYVLFDRFFSSATDGSGSNHFFWVGAYPADPHDVPKDGFTRPTIFDELEKAGVSWKFYVSNYDPKITFRAHVVGDRSSQVVWVPLLNYARYIDDPKLAKHIVPLTQYYKDLHDGTLPSVAYIAPSGASEHPPGSVQSGMRFVRTVINNLVASPYWDSSAFLLSYDDWGGWYDHVRPPQIDGFGYGFRVPALLVSPYARRGYVDHTTLDFTSGLKFIEENWGLAPLTRRDATATSIAGAFDFNQAPRAARIIPATRKVTPPVVAKRSIIYPAYSIGAAVVVLLILVAVYRTRRMRSHRVGTAVLGDVDS